MPKKTRKCFTAQEKVAILRLHLLEQTPIPDLCDQYGIHPTMFYPWQKEFFENAAAAFEPRARWASDAKDRKITLREQELPHKNEVRSRSRVEGDKRTEKSRNPTRVMPVSEATGRERPRLRVGGERFSRLRFRESLRLGSNQSRHSFQPPAPSSCCREVHELPIEGPSDASLQIASVSSDRYVVDHITVLMWPSWLCGPQPIGAENPALSRSGTPHNSVLADSNRPGVAGTCVTGTANEGAGVDRQIRASLWPNLGVNGRVSSNLVQGGHCIDGLPSGSVTR